MDTYGDAPVLRLRTAFADGSIVETVAVASEGIFRPRPGLDPFEAFRVGDAAGRSVALIRDVPVADVVRTHRDRVRALGATTPRSHADLADAVDLWNAAAHHTLETSRSLRRWRLLAGLGWLLVASLPALVVAWGVGSALGVVPGVLLGLLAGAVTLVLLVPLIRSTGRALARARWWRPAYAGPS